MGTCYCTVLFFAPDGRLVGKHRKLMPTASERLIWGFGDGSTLTVIDSPYGRIGSVICWENYMPMLRMAMYSKGVTRSARPRPTIATRGFRRCNTLRWKDDVSSSRPVSFCGSETSQRRYASASVILRRRVDAGRKRDHQPTRPGACWSTLRWRDDPHGDRSTFTTFAAASSTSMSWDTTAAPTSFS